MAYSYEKKRKLEELLLNKSNEIAEKNMHLRVIEEQYNETLTSLSNLTTEQDKLFQAYNEDVKEHQNTVRTELELREKELQKREEELQKKEARNDEERKKSALQNRENEELRKRITQLETQINVKQGFDLEIERLRKSLSVMEQINNTWKALHDKEKLEVVEEVNQELNVMERKTNDEVQEARKKLINFLEESTEKFPHCIGLKEMGQLCLSTFYAACKEKYAGREAGEKTLELLSLWEDHLRNPHWHPFKIVPLENGDQKEIIDEEDEKLKKLNAEWGSEVKMAVTTALMELNEYNPSGRQVVGELWNYEKEEKATLAEGVSYLLDLLRKKERKKRKLELLLQEYDDEEA